MDEFTKAYVREGYPERSVDSLIQTLAKMTDGFERLGQSTLIGTVYKYDKYGRVLTPNMNYMEGHYEMDGTNFAVLKHGWKIYIFDNGASIHYTHMLLDKDTFDAIKKEYLIVELDFEPDYVKEYWRKKKYEEIDKLFLDTIDKNVYKVDDYTLKKGYESICEEYRRRINMQWGLDYKDSWWPKDDVGSTLILNDCEFSLGMTDVILFVDGNISYEDFTDWWYYTLDENNENVNAYSWFIAGYRPNNYKQWKEETEEKLRKIREDGERQRNSVEG